MTKQAFTERRKWLRAKRVLSIEYRLHKTTKKEIDPKWYLSTTQDMSLGGLSFYTEKEYKANNVLEIKVVMSGLLEIFNGLGKVVRSEKKRTGRYYLTAIKIIDQAKKRSAKNYTSRQPKTTLKKK